VPDAGHPPIHTQRVTRLEARPGRHIGNRAFADGEVENTLSASSNVAFVLAFADRALARLHSSDDVQIGIECPRPVFLQQFWQKQTASSL
jgi:hypothetical protein